MMNKVSSPTTKSIGQHFEKMACEFLCQQGMLLVESNYTTKLGEIDLIFLDNNTLVFVEVRYRKQSSFASAAESITLSKQKKIINCAQLFINHHSQFLNIHCRFDVVAIDNKHQINHLNWIKNAFGES